MNERAVIPRLLLRLGLVFAVCTLLAVSFAGASYADYTYREYTITWTEVLVRALADWWPWVVIAVPVILLSERFRFERGRWPTALAVHVPGALVCSVVKTIAKVSVLNAIYDTDGMRAGMGEIARGMLVYWAIVAAVHGLEYQRRYRERTVRASQLESQLAQARLQVLRTQLQPHFLFNTLHAISTLMRRDADAAETMITRLGDLLRLTLEGSGADRVTLEAELDLLHHYLAIEEVRFGDRLVVTYEIPPACRPALVPNLILQPLVENAVRHGVSARSAAERITVRAAMVDDTLVLEVIDDGPGFDPDVGPEGVGLTNTRARLEQLYGSAGTLTLDNADDGGARVRVAIPYCSGSAA